MGNFYINTESFEGKLEKEFEKLKSSIKRPNILLLGQTGVGKSSLINCVFGEELAQVSDVKPETRGFHLYKSYDIPVNIIDSEGYELENNSDFRDALEAYIGETYKDVEKQMHLAWYCISTPSARVFDYDIENIRLVLGMKIPVAVVLTKCDLDDPDGSIANSLKAIIDKNFGGNVPCFQVCNDEDLNKELDLDKMIQWSTDNISDENLKHGFIIAQKANLEMKDEVAKSKVKYFAGVAGGIGGSPIPMSDAVLLSGLQMEMVAYIFKIYGLDNSLSAITKNFIQSKVISVIGRMIAGNLIKCIPELGSAAGAVINASVAASITYSLGYGMCMLSRHAIENSLTGNTTLESILTEENLNLFFKKGEIEAKKVGS